MKEEKKNEHIKTGEEILKTLQHGIELPKRLNQKWVSLYWLYDEITMEQSKKSNSLEYDNGLEFVLSLLEESK